MTMSNEALIIVKMITASHMTHVILNKYFSKTSDTRSKGKKEALWRMVG